MKALSAGKVALLALSAPALLLGLPLIGVLASGHPLGRYLEFPPRTLYVAHAGFSWPVFAALGVLIMATVLPFLLRFLAVRAPRAPETPLARRRFPWWGWAGIAGGAAAWVLAWTRFPWFQPLQPFTFSPLWLAYILAMNALAFQRTGRCLLTHRRPFLLALFPVSAAFWWFFEYLNRFVQNWAYEGVGNLTGAQYVLFATLPFSTVLPAVLSTMEWLKSFSRVEGAWSHGTRVRIGRPGIPAGAVLLAASAGLAGIALYPDQLFPLLWVAPLGVLASLLWFGSGRCGLEPLASGDWRPVAIPALAALLCGFFWEMWNFHSLAKWIYQVPYVQRYPIFEMPLLGYAGYLPFGLECALLGMIVDEAMRKREKTPS